MHRSVNFARRVLCFLAILATAASCTTTAEGPREADATRSRELQQLLSTYNEVVRAPAWAAAVVKDGKLVAVAGIGVRNMESGVPLDVGTALFHWGSITKSVTATMLAGLVEEGVLSWNSTLAALFPGMPMREEYRNVTIAQLMNHRADLPPYTRLGPPEARRFAGYIGTPVEKRDTFVREVLQEAPPPRGEMGLVYSNAGPAVAAHAAEVASGLSWEDLVRKYVFQRIGMHSAGFGLPASVAADQTRGHAGPDANSLAVMGAGPTPASPMIDPAGNIHSTVQDLALYARAHLLGLKDRRGPLDARSVHILHSPPDDGRTMGPEANGYAMGWGLRREGDQLVHWHNGSAGQFFAEVDIYPEEDLAIVVMTNAGFPGRSVPDLIRRIRSLYSVAR
jgi:CubicO group peptidase (beta-lactamase class C family)